MKYLGSSAILAVAALALATPAMAVTNIQFTNSKATWFAIVGGDDVNFSGNGTANARVRWGEVDRRDPQSGYRFEAFNPLMTVNPLTDTSAVTNIGEFTHYNWPIGSGSGIQSAKLKFTTDVYVNGSFLQTVDFVYSFIHHETPNGANPCAYGGANNQGVNINGCADKVSVNFLQESGHFTIDAVDYALDVRGFLVNGNPVSDFLTVEKRDNEAYLRGQIVLRSDAGEVVPEPATWAMLIAGFGMVGTAMRRRKLVVSQ